MSLPYAKPIVQQSASKIYTNLCMPKTRFKQNGGKSWRFASCFFFSRTTADDLYKPIRRIAFNKDYCRSLVAWRYLEEGKAN